MNFSMARLFHAKFLVVVVGAGLFLAAQSFAAEMTQKSGPFKGPKANTGFVTSSIEGGKLVLALSNDFKTPDTPDPHWQVVDSAGTVYDLQKIAIKDNKMNRKITLPAYVKDVAKVVIWCAWAETNLGEASFEKPIMLSSN
jgi:hypothetical protein